MIKVLFVHIGNPVAEDFNEPGITLVEMPTLNGEMRNFREKDLFNNINTRKALEDLPEVKLDHVCFTNRKSLSGLIKSGFALRKILKQRRYDVCHAFWGSSSGLIISLFSPVPTLVALAGSDLLGNYSKEGKPTIGGKISGVLSQIMSLFASKVITMSEHMKGQLNSIARRKCYVLPEGVNMNRFQPFDQKKARESLNYPIDKKIIVYFPSDFTWVKDPQLAQNVFNEVKNQMNNVEFVYVNNVPPSLVHLVYSAADVLLLTSRHEGSNNSIKEAMSCNLPVVTVNVGDASERLNHVKNSYVAKTRSSKELSTEIVAILRKGERSNGRDYVESISLENCAISTLKVYKELLKT